MCVCVWVQKPLGGAGFTVVFLFKIVDLDLQRLHELRVCHQDDEEHIT